MSSEPGRADVDILSLSRKTRRKLQKGLSAGREGPCPRQSALIDAAIHHLAGSALLCPARPSSTELAITNNDTAPTLPRGLHISPPLDRLTSERKPRHAAFISICNPFDYEIV